MQQTILTMCYDIANMRGWDLTISFDVDTLRVDFTCHDSMQMNRFLRIGKSYSTKFIKTLVNNLLDLHCGFMFDVPNGDLTKEKLN